MISFLNPVRFRRMRFSTRVLLGNFVLFFAGTASAQAPFPPLALTSAPSFEAASAAIGATKPEFSSYLLLDIPEISTEGMIHAIVKSELPGTTHLILLRQYPAYAGRKGVVDKASGKAVSTRAPASKGPLPRPKPPTVFIAAKQLKAGEPARLDANFEFGRNERFTLLVFAQGRWFGAAREVKLAREVSDRP